MQQYQPSYNRVKALFAGKFDEEEPSDLKKSIETARKDLASGKKLMTEAIQRGKRVSDSAQKHCKRELDEIEEDLCTCNGMLLVVMDWQKQPIVPQDWIEHIRDNVKQARDEIAEIAQDNGLSIIPSVTNFVAIDCGLDGIFAKSVLSFLVANGIFVRMPFVTPQDRCIRISVGLKEDLQLLAELLPKALSAASSRV